MNKKIIIATLVVSVAQADPSTTESMPLVAKPGQCFTKSFYPPKYTKITKIKSRKKVLLNDASIKYEVIPAKYTVHQERIKISDGTEKIVTIPATYKRVQERVLVEPSQLIWRKNLSKNAQKAFASCVESASKMGMDVSNSSAGTCFYEHYQAEKYQTLTSRILVSEASERIEVIPAKYRKVKKRIVTDSTTAKLLPSVAVYKKIKDKVVVEPARTEWRKTVCADMGCSQSEVVCLTEVPITYKQVTKKVVLQPAVKKVLSVKPIYKTIEVQELVVPAQSRTIPIEAKYKTISQRKKIEESKHFWTDASAKNMATRLRSECDKICLVSTPAKYKMISKQVLMTPASSRKIITPPRYTMVNIKKILQPASFKKVVIPEEYITVVTERERTKGYAKWMPMMCESQLTPNIIRKVQQALKYQGFYQGELNGVWDITSKSATRAYQKENNLAITNKLSIETMKSLGIY